MHFLINSDGLLAVGNFFFRKLFLGLLALKFFRVLLLQTRIGPVLA